MLADFYYNIIPKYPAPVEGGKGTRVEKGQLSSCLSTPPLQIGKIASMVEW